MDLLKIQEAIDKKGQELDKFTRDELLVQKQLSVITSQKDRCSGALSALKEIYNQYSEGSSNG